MKKHIGNLEGVKEVWKTQKNFEVSVFTEAWNVKMDFHLCIDWEAVNIYFSDDFCKDDRKTFKTFPEAP